MFWIGAAVRLAMVLAPASDTTAPTGAFVATTYVKHDSAPSDDGGGDGGPGGWYEATNCLYVAPEPDGAIAYEFHFELPYRVKCGMKGHAAPDGAGVWTDASQGCEVTLSLANGRWSVSEPDTSSPKACSKTRCRDAGFFVDTFEPSQASPRAKCGTLHKQPPT